MFFRCLLLVVIISTIQDLLSQNQINNWCFGDSAMLTFDGISTSPGTAPERSWEASATISDSSGNLLFYTNGISVYNKFGEVMDNGDSLNIDLVEPQGSSVTQGALILPVPDSEFIYYLFIIADSGLCYNIINMTLDGGSGSVVEKNKYVFKHKLMEKMQAVKHANGRDWWIITHQYTLPPDSTDVFDKILFTKDSIFVTNQTAGIKISGNSIGEMAVSKEGEKLAWVDKHGLQVFNFDRCSGEMSEAYLIPLDDISTDFLYGCCFSPDGNKLYIATQASDEFSRLYQYCFNCNDPFPETKKLIIDLVVPINFIIEYSIGQLERGTDDKIYFATGYNEIPNTIYSHYNKNLSVINDPNEEGFACNADTFTVSLGGHRAIAGLPNFPNYNLGSLIGSECDTIVSGINTEQINNFNVYPNPTNGFVYFDVENSYDHFHLIITNLLGTVIMDEEIYNLSSTQFPVDLSDYSNGVYLFKICYNDHILFDGKILKY